jgi:hypothetical protein
VIRKNTPVTGQTFASGYIHGQDNNKNLEQQNLHRHAYLHNDFKLILH